MLAGRRALTWRFRQSIDYWSVPHFLLGTLVALIGGVFSLPAWPLLFVTLIVAVLWEIVEMRLRIRETRLNVASDIVLPLLAYVATLWLTGGTDMTHERMIALLIVAVIFYVLANYAAWAARMSLDPDFQD